MQDLLGIRVVTYFYEDVQLIYNYFKQQPFYIDEQVDIPELTEFRPRRTNLILRIPNETMDLWNQAIKGDNEKRLKFVDSTYELQLRTIFSEGWHEIDHSLRYKCPQNWFLLTEEERLFNGIFASLETSDQTLLKLFDDMAYKHYKNRNAEPLIRSKFRLNFGTDKLNNGLEDIIIKQKGLMKIIQRLDRKEIVMTLLQQPKSFPVNVNNFLYFLNYFWIGNETITSITPEALIDDFSLFYVEQED
jgi:hypothetical protein